MKYEELNEIYYDLNQITSDLITSILINLNKYDLFKFEKLKNFCEENYERYSYFDSFNDFYENFNQNDKEFKQLIKDFIFNEYYEENNFALFNDIINIKDKKFRNNLISVAQKQLEEKINTSIDFKKKFLEINELKSIYFDIIYSSYIILRISNQYNIKLNESIIKNSTMYFLYSIKNYQDKDYIKIELDVYFKSKDFHKYLYNYLNNYENKDVVNNFLKKLELIPEFYALYEKEKLNNEIILKSDNEKNNLLKFKI